MLQLDSVCKQYPRRAGSSGWWRRGRAGERRGRPALATTDRDGADDRVDALLPTSLAIANGEFVAVVGPSGSGKTTFLSLLGGMLAPSKGKVIFAGESLYDLSAARRARLRNERIGFVFQHFNLVPWLTALENVQLPLCLFGSEADVQRARAAELLARFGLEDRLDHKPAELSAGQQQRIALARTLVMDPPLVLADEPTGSLDPDSRQVVLGALAACHREGRTIVLVTHDPAVARLAERHLRIVAGRVLEVPGDTATAA
jgi:putative ABC transport system ATP-binding protein